MKDQNKRNDENFKNERLSRIDKNSYRIDTEMLAGIQNVKEVTDRNEIM